ncbi:MAG: hypothetical protein J3K34DRAFT_434313 [Monoraphidium minutum]|nr:MAG: hypothetical protein J3K34DRAFT_434313 [Monoraphidium minutum]
MPIPSQPLVVETSPVRRCRYAKACLLGGMAAAAPLPTARRAGTAASKGGRSLEPAHARGCGGGARARAAWARSHAAPARLGRLFKLSGPWAWAPTAATPLFRQRHETRGLRRGPRCEQAKRARPPDCGRRARAKQPVGDGRRRGRAPAPLVGRPMRSLHCPSASRLTAWPFNPQPSVAGRLPTSRPQHCKAPRAPPGRGAPALRQAARRRARGYTPCPFGGGPRAAALRRAAFRNNLRPSHLFVCWHCSR